MKSRTVSVSPEYLDSLCEWMEEWSKDENSYIIPQFLQKHGIGYPYLKYFVEQSPKVCGYFEVMKATLCNRWLDLSLKKDNLPPHRTKVLMRYLRIYDSHGFDMEQQSKEQIAAASKEAETKYIIENYGKQPIDKDYESHYSNNTNKRRDRKET